MEEATSENLTDKLNKIAEEYRSTRDLSEEPDETNQENVTEEPEDNQILPGEVSDEGGEEGEPELDEYTPNYVVKSYGEEKEIEDWAKPLINQENETMFRQLYEKAYGLDKTKERLEKTRAESEAVRSGLDNFQKLLESKDMDTVFKTLKISDDDVFDYANKKLDYLQMSPAEKSRIDESAAAKARRDELETQNKMIMEQMRDINARAHNMEFKEELNKNTDIVKDFDTKFGDGAFEQSVRDIAIAHWHNAQKDLTVSEAVAVAKKRFGYGDDFKPQAVAKGTPKRTITKKTTKETIKDAGGTTAGSEVSQKITSMDDLLRLKNEALKKTGGYSMVRRG